MSENIIRIVDIDPVIASLTDAEVNMLLDYIVENGTEISR